MLPYNPRRQRGESIWRSETWVDSRLPSDLDFGRFARLRWFVPGAQKKGDDVSFVRLSALPAASRGGIPDNRHYLLLRQRFPQHPRARRAANETGLEQHACNSGVPCTTISCNLKTRIKPYFTFFCLTK